MAVVIGQAGEHLSEGEVPQNLQLGMLVKGYNNDFQHKAAEVDLDDKKKKWPTNFEAYWRQCKYISSLTK